MNQFFHILKYKFKAYIRFDSKISTVSIIKSFGSFIVYAAFAIGAFYFSKALINFLLVDIAIGHFLLHEFVSMILFIFFLSINAGNILVSYSTLYKSTEVNFLLTKPITPAKIFTIKFLDNFFYSSSTLLMILFSLLLGYCVYFNLSIIQFLFLLIKFFPFMVSAGSLGGILLIVVILLAKRFGVRKIIYTFGAIYFSLILLFFRINSPRQLVRSVLSYYPTIDKDIYLGDLIPSILKILRNNWLSQTAYWMLKDDYSKVIAYSILQIVLAVILFTISYQLGKKYYFQTWLLNQKLTADLNSKKQNTPPFFNSKTRNTTQLKSFFRKDFLTFVREPSQVIHALVLIFLITIFVISVAGIKYIGLGNFYLQTMIYLSIFIFNLLLISTLSLRFIFPLISLEGQPFWKLKSAPISIKKYLFNKLYVPGSIVLFTSIMLSYFSNYKFGIVLISFTILITILATVTLVSISFGMGGFFVNYKEKNPIRISSSQGASLTFLLSLLYILFLVVLLFKPLSQLFLSIMIKNSFNLLGMYYYIIPMIIVSAIIIGIFLKAAFSSLKRDF